MSHKISIIDIGSNTIRLVIYEKRQDRYSYECIENIKETARLRSRFDKEGNLSEEGINILVSTLREFMKIVDHYGADECVAVATASLRLAENCDDVLARVKAETNIEIRLLSDYEEAYYGYFAVHHSISLQEAVTIDIGGGSTEITYFKDGKMKNYHSFHFGALSLKMEYISDEMLTAKEQKRMKQFLAEQFASLDWLQNLQVPVIAIGGSARNIGRVYQQIVDYPLDELHHYEMTVKQLRKVEEVISEQSLSSLQKMDVIDKERADTLQPAIATFIALCETVGTSTWIISNRGLRDGLLYEMQGKTEEQSDELIEESLYELKSRFYIGNQQEDDLRRLALQLFHEVNHLRPVFNSSDERLLRLATPIFNLGKKADAETSNMTFFLVSHYTLLGLSQKERIAIALIASFKNRRLFNQYAEPFSPWFTEEELHRYAALGAILKVAQTLDRTKTSHVKMIIISEPKESQWEAKIIYECSIMAEKYHFNRQKKHLEKQFNVVISPNFVEKL